MDWSRAKSIFIISFIVLDLFLLAQLNQMMEKKSRYLKSNEITEEQIRELLEVNHIKLAVAFPKEEQNITVQQAAISHLSNWSHDEKWTYTKTFPGGLRYKSQVDLNKILKEQVPFFKQYHFAKKHSSKTQLVYLQKQNSYYIFDGKLICEINNGKLHSISVLHFKMQNEIPVEYISINNALATMITNGKLPKNSTITEISLGYRSLYSANSQEVILIPVWQFRANQKYYYASATNATTTTISENSEPLP